MPKQSAGIMLYRVQAQKLEVFLVHPGGPFWAKKDAGAWSVPKGEYAEGEEALAAAHREFHEETGQPVPTGEALPLGEVKYNNKVVTVWAVAGEFDPARFHSNTFKMEWPPRTGQQQEFPEVDRAAWFVAAQAKAKLVKAQAAFVDRLEAALGLQAAPEALPLEQISLL